MCGFFFFKQKTAYEMRISDWSSDVCSSDLRVGGEIEREVERGDEAARADRHALPDALIAARALRDVERLHLAGHPHRFLGGDAEGVDEARDLAFRIVDRLPRLDAPGEAISRARCREGVCQTV